MKVIIRRTVSLWLTVFSLYMTGCILVPAGKSVEAYNARSDQGDFTEAYWIEPNNLILVFEGRPFDPKNASFFPLGRYAITLNLKTLVDEYEGTAYHSPTHWHYSRSGKELTFRFNGKNSIISAHDTFGTYTENAKPSEAKRLPFEQSKQFVESDIHEMKVHESEYYRYYLSIYHYQGLNYVFRDSKIERLSIFFGGPYIEKIGKENKIYLKERTPIPAFGWSQM